MTVIPNDFSVFELVERSRQGSIRIRERKEMARICALIENRIAEEKLDGIVLVGFQTISNFITRRTQYEALADHLDHIYVFAYQDTDPPQIENVEFIALQPSHQLVNEWFLIFHSRTYFSALVGRELHNHEKSFESIWTFDLDIIQIISDWLSGVLGIKIIPYMTYDHEEQGRLMDEDLDDYLNNSP